MAEDTENRIKRAGLSLPSDAQVKGISDTSIQKAFEKGFYFRRDGQLAPIPGGEPMEVGHPEPEWKGKAGGQGKSKDPKEAASAAESQATQDLARLIATGQAELVPGPAQRLYGGV